MDISHNSQIFETRWFGLAEEICEQIYQDPEVRSMQERFKNGERLTDEDRSNFVSIADRVKYEIVHREFGEDGSGQFKEFSQAWAHWFNSKQGGNSSGVLAGRILTNVEHIVYSSTPELEEFFRNFK